MQNISAVRDALGNVVQIRGLMLDVTEQKMFQSQLQRERDFNQKILRAPAGGVGGSLASKGF